MRATLPRINRRSPVCPRVPTTTSPAPCWRALVTISCAGSPSRISGSARRPASTKAVGGGLAVELGRSALGGRSIGIAIRGLGVDERRDRGRVREAVLIDGHDGHRQSPEDRPVEQDLFGRPGVARLVVGEDDRPEPLVAGDEDGTRGVVDDLRRDRPEQDRFPATVTAISEDDEIGRHRPRFLDDHRRRSAVGEDRFDDEVGAGGADLALGRFEGVAMDPQRVLVDHPASDPTG